MSDRTVAIIGIIGAAAILTFIFCYYPASAQTVPGWDYGEDAAGTWDEYDLNSNLGEGSIMVGNRWHATSTDALSLCGFRTWWKKTSDVAMSSPILWFEALEGTTGTQAMMVMSTSTVPGNTIGTDQTEIDTYLPACLTVNHGITWAIYYYVNSTNSSYVTYTNDLGGDTHVQLTTLNASGTVSNASGDLKMGMAELITNEAPAVELPENCTYGIFCPLISGIRWLFVPTSGVQGFFDDRKSDLMTRVPFGYFETVSSTFAGLDPSGDSTTSTILSITASTTGVHQSVEIFNPTALEASIPSNIKTFLHAIGSMAVWALFFVWIARFAFSGKPFDFLGVEPPHEDDL